jgi:hypothetical protein
MINDAEGIRRRIVTKRARCTGGSATPAGFIGVNAYPTSERRDTAQSNSAHNAKHDPDQIFGKSRN